MARARGLSVPATALEATEEGKYVVVEVKLQGDRCAFDVAPNGDLVAGASPFAAAAAGRSASDADLLASTRTIREKAKAPPSAINWRLTTYSDAPEGRRRGRRTTRARYWNHRRGVVSGDAQRASLGEGLCRTQRAREAVRTARTRRRRWEVVDPSAPEGRNQAARAGAGEGEARARGRARRSAMRRQPAARAEGRGRGGGVERTLRGSREKLRRSIEESKARSASRARGARRAFAEKEAKETRRASEWRLQTRGDVGRFRTKRNAYLESIAATESVRAGRRSEARRRRGKRPTRRGGVRTARAVYSCHSRKTRTGRIDESSHHRCARGAAAAGEIVSRRRRRRSTSALSAGRGRGLGLPPPHTLRTHRR